MKALLKSVAFLSLCAAFVISQQARAGLGSSVGYEDEDIRVSFVKAYVEEEMVGGIDFSTLNVELMVEPLNPTKIIKPRTSMVYSYDRETKGRKTVPVGFDIKDNYGNEMYVKSVTPEYPGAHTYAKGLRNGDKIKIALEVNEVPLPTAKYISLLISKDNFKTSKDVEIKIPAELVE